MTTVPARANFDTGTDEADGKIEGLVARFQSGTNRWVFEVVYEDASTGPPTIGSLVDAAHFARSAGLTRVPTRDGTARWTRRDGR